MSVPAFIDITEEDQVRHMPLKNVLTLFLLWMSRYRETISADKLSMLASRDANRYEMLTATGC